MAPSVVPIVKSGTSPVHTDVYEHGDALVLVLSGEPYAGRQLRALITFECSVSAPAYPISTRHTDSTPFQTDTDQLELAVSGSVTHAFTWRTPHACQTSTPALARFAINDEPPSHEHNPDHSHRYPPPGKDRKSADPDKPENDLLPPVNDHISLRTVTIILVVSFATLGAFYYLATHPPEWSKPYLRIVGRKMRRLRRWRGRPGESRLLRWAEEDLPIFGLDEDEAYVFLAL